MQVRLVAPLHNHSGYAKAGRATLAALRTIGFEVEAVETEINIIRSAVANPYTGAPLVETRVSMFAHRKRPAVQEAELTEALNTKVAPDAPTIVMTPPDAMTEWPEYAAGARIALTMFEADTIAPLWARALCNADGILVPCEWNWLAIKESPHIPERITRVIPLCVDERLWSPGGPIATIAERPEFVFLSIFSTCARKHWPELMQAFTEEFLGESVGLIVKPTVPEPVRDFAAQCAARGAWIQVLDEVIDDFQLASLYRGTDAFALPSTEGFGLTFIEAAMCGLPICCLDEGGTWEASNLPGAFAIESEEEACVGLLPGVYRSNHKRFTASVPEIRRALRLCYESRREPLGQQNRDYALRRFSRLAVGELLQDAVFDIAEQAQADRNYFFNVTKYEEGRADAVFVMTTHNYEEHTRRAIESIHLNAKGASILIADDESEDGTRPWLTARGIPWIDCAHGNVSENRQKAIDYLLEQNPSWHKFSAAPFVVFCDNDIEIPQGFLEGIRAIFRHYSDVGILAPRKTYKKDGTTQNVGNRLYANAGTFPVKLPRFMVYPDYVETACMVARPEVWSTCRWDGQFPLFYEDVDYCFQARALGFSIAATAAVTVVHDAHTTSYARNTETERNRNRFLIKWREVI